MEADVVGGPDVVEPGRADAGQRALGRDSIAAEDLTGEERSDPDAHGHGSDGTQSIDLKQACLGFTNFRREGRDRQRQRRPVARHGGTGVRGDPRP